MYAVKEGIAYLSVFVALLVSLGKRDVIVRERIADLRNVLAIISQDSVILTCVKGVLWIDRNVKTIAFY